MPEAETAGPAEKREGFEFVLIRKETVWDDSFDGPLLIAVAQLPTDCEPASSRSLWLLPLANDGWSLTALIVRVKTFVALVSSPPNATPPLSVSVTLTSVWPKAFGLGVKVRVPELLTSGGVVNRLGSSVRTSKERVCPLSSDGPLLSPVAQPCE